jgi:RimJ/RimL family protein N-acetyltransferase
MKPQAPAPRIETPRLTLRGHRADDHAAATAMWADPAVTLHIGGRPSSAQQTWARILSYVGHWTLMGFGYWAVEERTTSRFIGEVGFADFRRDIQPSIAGMPELGWALATAYHGRGYGTEAVMAALNWGDGHLPSPRTVCIIDDGNAASIRVARKCRYRETAATTYGGSAVTLFSRG